MVRAFALATLVILGLSPGGAEAQAPPARLKVVASMSILADFVRQVGGDLVEVSALVGPNADVHAFEPSPADAKKLVGARLVVTNGLGLEGWLPRLIKASGTNAPVLVASQGVKPIAEPEQGPTHAAPAAHHDDPHAWQSVPNAKIYVENIRAALTRVDPADEAAYRANAGAYTARLDALDRDVRTALAAVPPSQREIITTHDAFGYFGNAYGFRFTAPQGVSTESEANAADVARIIRQIRARKVRAVFLENVSDPRLAERIASESGARIGDKVYSDALSEPGGPAGTYLDMMRHNVQAFVAALSD